MRRRLLVQQQNDRGDLPKRIYPNKHDETSGSCKVSEELRARGLLEHGWIIANYEYYEIGATTLNQLKSARIVPNKQYKKYGSRKPDGLLVDRRNKENIRVICVVERKDTGRFNSDKDRKATVQQCNDICQEVEASIGIATDGTFFSWFNPKQFAAGNEYFDETTGIARSYTIIKDETGNEFVKQFVIDKPTIEYDLAKISPQTRATFQHIDTLLGSISNRNSQIVKEPTIDPTNFAKQIWQDIWFVTSASPQQCLYTFLELFIFKYLSDLDILRKDGKGNKVNFKDVYALSPDEAFQNYVGNVRPYLKLICPPDPEDGTTIINGTVLDPNIPEHKRVFHRILKKFNDFGELKNIDPGFKSKVFEEFMKETISQKNMGQFFTPRKIIDAIVEISDIDKLSRDSVVCDPACGVGGFILEPFKMNDRGVNYYYEVVGEKIVPRLKFYGFDKGYEKEEQLTIILAKANMLIFLSELLKKNPTLVKEFGRLFNTTFKLLNKTALGTISMTPLDQYDLILTNPPYVTSGSSNFKMEIKQDSRLRNYYTINAFGIEGLFLEWIIRSLKPDKKAFIIIPHGILSRSNGHKLRKFIRDQCIMDAIMSLPEDTFYRNPMKTYIMAITKKPETTDPDREAHKQLEPVFTYLVTSIGETLDVNRFPRDENDLPEMVSLFNQFKGAKKSFRSISKKCRIQPIEKFDPKHQWLVDLWWTQEEWIELGIGKQELTMTVDQFKEKVNMLEVKLRELNERLKKL